MAKPPIVTAIEVHEFQFEVQNMTRSRNGDTKYAPGETIHTTNVALKVHTDSGIVGEYINSRMVDASAIRMLAGAVLGENALERERLYTDMKRATQNVSRLGVGLIDIALWDIAGKYHDAPVYQLLGGYRRRLPTYASTYFGDDTPGGLDTPEAYADFAQRCLEMGYPAYKIHPWKNGPVARDIEMIERVAARVGDRMVLMWDAGCKYETLADAVRVGRALDEANFYWYEDPYKDTGISAFGHKKLRHLVRTPLLMTEFNRMLEPHIDFALAGGTDFLRADPDFDGGITGVMKIAHAAEGLGLDVELHASNTARRHCIAAIRNSNYYELCLVHPDAGPYNPPVYKHGYSDALDSIDKEGYVTVPEGPGLGIEYDWDYIMEHRTAGAEYK
ncbi:MAG: enolase C-terminal domain-like protein [Dehalococcoidia bacterium]|jgi:L-alanine-DL-glutamate epimerase-like enolase superfamily enzyme|nr:enolase C-terminal domain-like protein [Dehalococcoidia bacterium]MDP7084580.1 enolase C-terminal domain-like protein [Dehalococcoidia bacterium]MDP7201496.1 enolase C-terminal domain-like protein [Dehalococcoidia bacterium]MDP7509795.1 enolase C-terminal domain-like protein [Dehalococcoidia bacterium]